MDQYSNLNVHGSIKQQASQGTQNDDVVLYPTMKSYGNIITVSGTDPYDSSVTTYHNGVLVKTSNGLVYVCTTDTPSSNSDFIITGKVYYADDTTTTLSGTTFSQKSGVVTASDGTAIDTSIGSTTEIPKVTVDTYGRVVATGKATVYPPTTAGTANQVWISQGSGAGKWETLKTINSGSLLTTGDIKLVPHNDTTANQVYATDGSKVDTPISYSTGATQGHIVQRASGGQVTVPLTPANDSDAASKQFVNSSIGTATANFLGTYDATDNLGLTVTVDSSGNITAPTNAAISTALDTYLNADYTTFTTTADYVGYYVEQTDGTDTVEVLVTSANKDTLSSPAITPGTTEAYPQVSPTPNDYVFVSLNKSTTTDVDEYRRFKASEDTSVTPTVIVWEYEYTLNNSSFTQAQWNAINSGMSTADKTKLDGIEAGAQVNVIETVKVNNTALTVTSKAVDIPAATTSAFGVVEVGSGTALAVSSGVITSLVTSPGNDVEFTNWPA